MTASLGWDALLNARRFSDDLREKKASKTSPEWLSEARREIERDYDRILFSTPVRRLADKTQVFPLEKNESVRSRLTHSHEVSNLARSIGMNIAFSNIGQRIANEIGGPGGQSRVQRDVPAMLAAIGLAHDLGNPPFGHQGESAIRSWFKRNKDALFAPVERGDYADKQAVWDANHSICRKLSEPEEKDFLSFEGNAQTLRVLSRLQVVQDDLGLNLTYGTLAAVMKYTASAGSAQGKKCANASLKKPGHFASEHAIVTAIWGQTGLCEGRRHPLAFIMEACDDIAYLVLDAEDAIKKQIVSFPDLIAALERSIDSDELAKFVVESALADYRKYRDIAQLSPSELNDVSMQKFRVYAIHAFMSAATETFEEKYDQIMTGTFEGDLISASRAHVLAEALRAFDSKHAYLNRRVKELELEGYNTVNGLMDLLWKGISEREEFLRFGSARKTPFAAYAYQSISENYRRVFEGWNNPIRKNEPNLPVRYRELQLLTDAVSGMTDGYVIDLYRQLKKYEVSTKNVD